MNSHTRTAQPPAGQTPIDMLTQVLGGLLAGHCLTSVTNFKVADALSDRPQTAAELAVVRPGEFGGRYVCELFVSLPVSSA